MYGRAIAAAALFAAGTMPAAAAAQEADMPPITAAQPDLIAQLLEATGDLVERRTDTYGDPQIVSTFGGYQGTVDFYDCDEQTHLGCTSLQFSVGLDRAVPWDMAAANEAARTMRFVSLHLDEEGDPWIQWDVVTGKDGIPAPVFLEAYNRFSDVVVEIADLVFAEEREIDGILDDSYSEQI